MDVNAALNPRYFRLMLLTEHAEQHGCPFTAR
jgi:hypothetical protein